MLLPNEALSDVGVSVGLEVCGAQVEGGAVTARNQRLGKREVAVVLQDVDLLGSEAGNREVAVSVAVPVRVHDDRELCEEVELERPGGREHAAAVVSEQCELGRRGVLPDHGEVTVTVAVEVGRGDPVGPGSRSDTWSPARRRRCRC